MAAVHRARLGRAWRWYRVGEAMRVKAYQWGGQGEMQEDSAFRCYH